MLHITVNRFGSVCKEGGREWESKIKGTERKLDDKVEGMAEVEFV